MHASCARCRSAIRSCSLPCCAPGGGSSSLPQRLLSACSCSKPRPLRKFAMLTSAVFTAAT